MLKLQKRVDDAGLLATVTFSSSSWGLGLEALRSLKLGPDDLRRILEEVDRCRPYFVGLLGEGYGSVPSIDGSVENLADQPVLAEHLWLAEAHNPYVPGGLRQSLTELEFVYGCICTGWEAAGHALLYLRAQAFVLKQTDPAERERYLPRARDKESGGGIPMSLKQSKLAAYDLKMRARTTTGVLSRQYDLPGSCIEMILNDTYEIVEAVLPRESVPNEMEKSHMMSNALMRTHERILDPALFEMQLIQLDMSLTKDTNLVLVKGDEGSGKTTFAFQVCPMSC